MLDHNPHRSRGHPVPVGENIAASPGSIAPAKAVDLWMSEAADYDLRSDRCRGVSERLSRARRRPSKRPSYTMNG